MSNTLIPFSKALRTHPKTAGVHPSSGRRWVAKGCLKSDGTLVRLDAEFIGGRLFLSHAAIDVFLAALNATRDASPAPRSPAVRQKSSELAEALLIAAGA